MFPSSRPSTSRPSVTSTLCTMNSYSSECCECATCDMYGCGSPGSNSNNHGIPYENERDHDQFFHQYSHPRQTFSFDRVLYQENDVEVTPTCINIKRDSIDIETIHHVEMKPNRNRRFMRTWKNCWRKLPIPNVYLYLNNGNVRALRAENPADLKLAIRNARSITYN